MRRPLGRTSCACAGRATSSGRSTSSAEPAMASGLRTFQHMVSCHQNHLLLLFLVDIISELGLFVAGGRHPLVCRWRHWWGVRRVQAGLASDRLLVDNLEMSSAHFQRCIFQRFGILSQACGTKLATCLMTYSWPLALGGAKEKLKISEKRENRSALQSLTQPTYPSRFTFLNREEKLWPGRGSIFC